MERHELPPWGDDPLSAFMAQAEHNIRATALNWPDVYEVQQRTYVLLARIRELLETDPADVHLGVPRLLIARSHVAILAAMRSAMSGQVVEAQPELRLAIEAAWYALHVAKDPAPPARGRTWWERGESPQATQACKNEFTVANVRATHEQVDPPTGAVMRGLYENTIDHGGHPNQGGVASSLVIDRSRSAVEVGMLYAGTLPVLGTLKVTIDVAIGSAKTASLVYPERFRIAGVDGQTDQLVRHSAEAFGKRARAAQATLSPARRAP